MENISPIGIHKPMPYPNLGPYPNMMPTAAAPLATGPVNIAPMPQYPAPINVHASYEEINIYAPKKHPYYHGPWTSAGVILVLYILLVIVLRSLSRI